MRNWGWKWKTIITEYELRIQLQQFSIYPNISLWFHFINSLVMKIKIKLYLAGFIIHVLLANVKNSYINNIVVFAIR